MQQIEKWEESQQAARRPASLQSQRAARRTLWELSATRLQKLGHARSLGLGFWVILSPENIIHGATVRHGKCGFNELLLCPYDGLLQTQLSSAPRA